MFLFGYKINPANVKFDEILPFCLLKDSATSSNIRGLNITRNIQHEIGFLRYCELLYRFYRLIKSRLNFWGLTIRKHRNALHHCGIVSIFRSALAINIAS